MKAKTAALKGLAATLGGMDGRKILVFVSHRFSRYAGLEFFLRDRDDVDGPAGPADAEARHEEAPRRGHADRERERGHRSTPSSRPGWTRPCPRRPTRALIEPRASTRSRSADASSSP